MSRSLASIEAPKTEISNAFRSAVIDELGEIERKLAEAKVRIYAEVGVDEVRHEQLARIVESWYRQIPNEQGAVYEGESQWLKIKPRELKATFTPAAKKQIYAELKKKLKNPLDAFYIYQNSVSAHLGEEFLQSVVTKDHTGARRYELVPKAPPAKAAEAIAA